MHEKVNYILCCAQTTQRLLFEPEQWQRMHALLDAYRMIDGLYRFRLGRGIPVAKLVEEIDPDPASPITPSQIQEALSAFEASALSFQQAHYDAIQDLFGPQEAAWIDCLPENEIIELHNNHLEEDRETFSQVISFLREVSGHSGVRLEKEVPPPSAAA